MGGVFTVGGAAALVVGYFLGSIPFGLLLTRLAGLGDIRMIGSGNIGATNVLRTGNLPVAGATLLADALKGLVAVLIGSQFGEAGGLVAALGAMLGHLWPVWIGFKGGKGVATYLGALLGVSWPAAIVFALVWGATAAISRYSSLSALLASLATPVGLIWFSGPGTALFFAALTALLWWRHEQNIRRLAAGAEMKIGEKR